jgi:hypothetical protein
LRRGMRSKLGKQERRLSLSCFVVIHLDGNYCTKYSFMI